MSAAPQFARLLQQQAKLPFGPSRYFVGKLELIGSTYPCQLTAVATSIADFERILRLLVQLRSPQRIPVEIFYDGKWIKRHISPRLAQRSLTLVACAP